MDFLFCSYFERYFTFNDFKVAHGFYLKWCEENENPPELTEEDIEFLEADDIEDSTIQHVLYHAEIQGFNIEETGKEQVEELEYSLD